MLWETRGSESDKKKKPDQGASVGLGSKNNL